MNRHQHYLSILFLMLMAAMSAMAQEVIVTVRPTRNPLPPQVLPYLDNPGRYFNVSVNNTSDYPQQIFFGLEIEQTLPGDFKLHTSIQKQPHRPLVIPPQSNLVLNQAQLRDLFKQLDMNDISLSKGSIDDFTKGIIGLMPEGEYMGTMTAYRWDPAVTTPEAVSNPMTGSCSFSICYSAAAPEITQPAATLANGMTESDIEFDNPITIDFEKNPIFSWTPVTTNCIGLMPAMYYDLQFYHLYPGQTPEEALASGNIAYQVKNIPVTQYMMTIPLSQRRIHFSDNAFYVMQVVAHPKDIAATDPNNEKYFAIKNDGKSPFRVLKIKYEKKEADDKKGDGMKEDGKQETEETKKDTVELVIAQPQLKKPEEKGVWNTYNFTLKDSLEIEWKPAMIAAGDSARFDTLKLDYEFRISKMQTGSVDIDSAIIQKPIYTKTYKRADTTIVVKWEDLKDKISIDDRLLVAVVVKADKKENKISYGEHGENIYTCRYRNYEDLFVANCFKKDSTLTKKPKDFKEEELKGQTVKVGRFELTLQKVSKVSGKEAFEGEGYVVWRPWGKDIKIAVDFDSIYINEAKQVVKGEVRSAKQKDTAIPYGILDGFGVNGWLDVESTSKFSKYEDDLKKKCGDYWKYLHGGMKELGNIYHIIDSSIGTDLHSDPFVLPLGMPKEMCPDLPFDISMMEMVFSPNTAYTNLIIMFTVPGYDPDKVSLGDGIMMFGSPCLCIEPDKLWSGSGMAGLLADISIQDPEIGYEFAFKAPTDYKEPTDGCYVTWENGKFNTLSIDCETNIPDLLLADDKGNLVPGTTPKFHLATTISNWEDWSAEVSLDPFQSPDALGYTFATTGKGIWIDHSKKWNPTGFAIPAGYDYKKTKFDKKNEKKWMGLWVDDMSMIFPDAFKAVYADKEEEESAGGEDKDKKEKGEKKVDDYGRIKVGLGKVLIDDSGLSLSAYAQNVLSAQTAKAGGWKFTLDNIHVSMVQNSFNDFGFNGTFNVPLLDGNIDYKCTVQQSAKDEKGNRDLSFDFQSTATKGLSLDFILAKATFDEKQTYFHFNCSKNTTKVELLTGGTVSISDKNKENNEKAKDAKEEKLPNFKLPGIKFVGMRLANFAGEGVYTTDTKNADKDMVKYLKENEISNDEKTFFFNIGKWSLASEEKDFWDFPLKLDDISPTVKGSNIGLYIQGGISIFGGEDKQKKNGVAASVGISLCAKVNWKNFDVSYDHTSFDKLILKGAFGGGLVDMSGEMTWKDGKNSKENGFDANLKIDVNGLFKFNAAGSYMKVDKTEDDYKIDEKIYGKIDRNDSTYESGHFYCDAEVASKLGPVSLSSIMGGFYFNKRLQTLEDPSDQSALKESLMKPENAYQCSGGAFGLGLAVGGDNMIKGKMAMVVMYDAGNDLLSQFRLSGKIDALTLPGQSEGLIKSTVDIVYQHKEPNSKSQNECKQFTMNITTSAKGDMAEMYKKFTGKTYQIPECMANMQEFDQEHADEENQGEQKAGAITAEVGGELSLEFQFSYFPNKAKDDKKKWHLYLGNPFEKRCSITFINLAFGKDKPIGAWAKLVAEAYLCLGNELPKDGALPPLPEAVSAALGMEEPDGKVYTKKQAELNKVREDTRNNGPQGKVNGGVMMGASLDGEFGCNAVFCYANLGATLGFDMILKQYAAGSRCQDGSRMGGKNGFYAMGQIYSRLEGELGLMIDLWIYKGKVPLVDLTFGALLKGGFPNPSWAYGKVRAKGSILCGLIKFNSSVELSVGKVCVPSFGNPLDDIKIFGDVTPGFEKKEEGWNEEEAVQPSTGIDFATNMKINSHLCLIDENEVYNRAGMDKDPEKYRQASQRIYEFRLDPAMKINGKDVKWESPSRDMEHFRLMTPMLDPNTKYEVTLSGFAKEIRNGKAVDPVFNDSTTGYKNKNRQWKQSANVYFMTGQLPKNAMENVQSFFPFEEEGVFLEEAASPKLLMQYDRSDFWDDPQYEYTVRMDRNLAGEYVPLNYHEDVLKGRPAKFLEIPIHQSIEETSEAGQKHRFISVDFDDPIPLEYIHKGATYRYQLIRTNKKALEDMINKCRETYKSMFKEGVRGATSLKDSIADLGTDTTYNFQKHLYEYYMHMDSLFGPNEAEIRVKEYLMTKKESAEFRTVLYTKTFSTGIHLNFREYLDYYNPYECPRTIKQNKSINTYSAKFDKISYTNTDLAKSYRPTSPLSYWNNEIITWKKFNDYDLGVGYSQPGGIEYQLSPFSNIPYPAPKKYDAQELEDIILPSKEWQNFYQFENHGENVVNLLQDLTKTTNLYLNMPNNIMTALRKKWNTIMPNYVMPTQTGSEDYFKDVFTKDVRKKWKQLNEANTGVYIPFEGGQIPFYQFAALFGRVTDYKDMFGYSQFDKAAYWKCLSITKGKDPDYDLSKYLKYVKGLSFLIKRNNGFDTQTSTYDVRPQYLHTNMFNLTKAMNDANGRWQDIRPAVNYVVFNDPNLQKFVIKHFDSNYDGRLQFEEAEKIKNLAYDLDARITSLIGIEHCPNLEMIRIPYLKCNIIDLSKNTKLKHFAVTHSMTQVKSITLDNLKQLEVLHLGTKADDRMFGELKGINLRELPQLIEFVCPNQRLEQLDLSFNTKLQNLDVSGNCLENIDISKCAQLSQVFAGRQWTAVDNDHTQPKLCYIRIGAQQKNLMEKMDISETTGDDKVIDLDYNKKTLDAYRNVNLYHKEADISNLLDPNLYAYLLEKYGQNVASMGSGRKGTSNTRKLFASKLLPVTTLDCSHLKIQSMENLDILMPNLETLNCSHNELIDFDAKGFKKLKELDCTGNSLCELICDAKTPLTSLKCADNNLMGLDFTTLTHLTYLDISGQQFNISGIQTCGQLKDLKCSHFKFITDNYQYVNFFGLNCESLDLSYSHVDHTYIALPATLKRLNINNTHCPIYISDCHELTTLSAANITDTEHLTAELRKMTSLTHLCLHGTTLKHDFIMGDVEIRDNPNAGNGPHLDIDASGLSALNAHDRDLYQQTRQAAGHEKVYVPLWTFSDCFKNIVELDISNSQNYVVNLHRMPKLKYLNCEGITGNDVYLDRHNRDIKMVYTSHLNIRTTENAIMAGMSKGYVVSAPHINSISAVATKSSTNASNSEQIFTAGLSNKYNQIMKDVDQSIYPYMGYMKGRLALIDINQLESDLLYHIHPEYKNLKVASYKEQGFYNYYPKDNNVKVGLGQHKPLEDKPLKVENVDENGKIQINPSNGNHNAAGKPLQMGTNEDKIKDALNKQSQGNSNNTINGLRPKGSAVTLEKDDKISEKPAISGNNDKVSEATNDSVKAKVDDASKKVMVDKIHDRQPVKKVPSYPSKRKPSTPVRTINRSSGTSQKSTPSKATPQRVVRTR